MAIARAKGNLRAERRTGWVKRAYKYFDAEITQFAAIKPQPHFRRMCCKP